MSKFVVALAALVVSIAPSVVPASGQTLVQNRDEPGRNKYQATATIPTSCSFQSGCVATFPVIPAGERVVVEYVSCRMFSNAGFSPVLVALAGQAINPTLRAYLPAISQGAYQNLSMFVVSSPIVFYFAAGDTPTVSVIFNGSVSSSPGDCLLTGYHVVLP